MMDVQKQIAAACRKHGKAWGRPVGTREDAKTLIDLGAQFIVHGAEFSAVCAHFAACSSDLDSILGGAQGAQTIPSGKNY
jgi:2-keto-3-deoxy-L-rhamnonate aldolase RhmA